MNISASSALLPASQGVGGALVPIVSGLHWLRIAHAERRLWARQRRSQLASSRAEVCADAGRAGSRDDDAQGRSP